MSMAKEIPSLDWHLLLCGTYPKLASDPLFRRSDRTSMVDEQRMHGFCLAGRGRTSQPLFPSYPFRPFRLDGWILLGTWKYQLPEVPPVGP
ncbi:Os07g0114550 [Oryza sativa Japonica Group]|uniref:Os07g0114550 protein n=2 Tax=Oryza sativa subsp. japonica TaxID=39947 RepID=C7J4I0_ORYSJ|nr:Os07g0114550 [Oryza sativa Japonica Group]BAS99794.1 Os07g0114550 [Oryza sativa Japonica Group]|eukprot:NP_001175021.1 Os07g0114550 [Oryza sativa Japonica Group]